MCLNTWVDLHSLEQGINPTSGHKKIVAEVREKVLKYWDMLDKKERTANEIVTLCSHLYDDTLVGDSAFVGDDDQSSSSEETDFSSDEDSIDAYQMRNDVEEGNNSLYIFRYIISVKCGKRFMFCGPKVEL